MPIQKFTIKYQADKPLFPINTFEFMVNPEYAAKNLKTLKGHLEILLRALVFIPTYKRTITHDYSNTQENRQCTRISACSMPQSTPIEINAQS